MWKILLIGGSALLVIAAIIIYEFWVKPFIEDIKTTIDNIENIEYKDY
jgi:hypothetical protein